MKLLIFLFAILLTVTSANAQYQHDSIKTDKGYIHYYVKGQGKPVVFLQGGPGYSSAYMKPVADSIKDIQCILIDYQGTGRSDYGNVDAAWVTNLNMIKDIETVREMLGIKKWAIVGHSYGATNALHYGVEYPQYVEKIITISSAGTNHQFQNHFSESILSKISMDDRRRMQELRSKDAGKEATGIGEADMIFLKGYFYNPEKIPLLFGSISPEELGSMFNPKFNSAYWTNADNPKFDINEKVLKTTIPIRMIESWQDPCYDGRQWVLNEKLNNSKISFINESGHFPWIEQPEKFFPLLRQFLEE
ncbi:MAG: alpha/beta hydrolase [Chitinophagaceae bacterium]|nr:alpha/beta hydrolase [Chitinophagaceae bacterium]